MRNINFITFLLFISCLFGCDKLLLDEELPDTPAGNFESLWTEFDEKYGLFRVKNINWDSVYDEYFPRVQHVKSHIELYDLFREMLEGLNDSHVGLLPTEGTGLPFYQSGILGKLDSIKDFDLNIIKDHYLLNTKFSDPFFTYGMLRNNIGYMHIEGFSDLPKFLEDPLNEILSDFKDTKGIIVDIRGGYGGEDLAGRYIAGRFAHDRIPYMQSRVKSGPGKDDFTSFHIWEIKPEGSIQYHKPVVVLTHRFTVSARETFCLAMKKLPQVTLVGDTTAGALSNQINRELPNGWGYSLSIGEWLDEKGNSYEGIGIVPDILVQNVKKDLEKGRDEMLENAIQLLE